MRRESREHAHDLLLKAWHNRNTLAVKTVWFAVPFRGKSALSLSFRADRLPILRQAQDALRLWERFPQSIFYDQVTADPISGYRGGHIDGIDSNYRPDLCISRQL